MPELQVGFDGKSYSMTEICGLVDNLGDELPTQVVDRLLYYMQAPHADLKASLSQERSYSVAARCLRELI